MCVVRSVISFNVNIPSAKINYLCVTHINVKNALFTALEGGSIVEKQYTMFFFSSFVSQHRNAISMVILARKIVLSERVEVFFCIFIDRVSTN